MKIVNYPVDDIIVDGHIYPRSSRVDAAIKRYVSAMQKGDIFPIIILGTIKGSETVYLVDGFHRLSAVIKLLEYVPYNYHRGGTIRAELRKYGGKDEMYMDAARENGKNGQPFEEYERMSIATRLRGLGRTDEEISDVLRIPKEEVERISIKALEMKSCAVCRKILPPEEELEQLFEERMEKKPEPTNHYNKRLEEHLKAFDNRIVVAVAQTVHKQWCEWSTRAVQESHMPPNRLAYYKCLWKEWKDLNEHDQDQFMNQARRILSATEAACVGTVQQQERPIISKQPPTEKEKLVQQVHEKYPGVEI